MRLVWGRPQDRRFEHSLDRGVLYLPNRNGVAWSGLTAVDEQFGDVTMMPYYYDGRKNRDERGTTESSFVIKAFTYPKEFLPFDGVQPVSEGLYAGDQPVYDYFHLSWRTMLGDGLKEEAGYFLHFLYNCTATPETRSNATRTTIATLKDFSWKVDAVPVTVPGRKPTAYFRIDSREANPVGLEHVERMLYGNDDGGISVLPDLAMIIELVETTEPIVSLITEPLGATI